MTRSLILLMLCAMFCQSGQATVAFASSVEIRGGFIVLEANMNGIQGNYILDTGAPGIVLNKKYFASGADLRSDQLEGVNGSVQTDIVRDWHFSWNTFQAEGRDAYAIDLTYLEDAVGNRIDGLLGLELFDGYYVLIDYSNESLELWSSIPSVFSRQPTVSLPLESHNHVPFVVLQHGQKSYRFALDSGSKSHLVDQSATKTWGAAVSYLSPIELVGADQRVMQTSKVEVTGLDAYGISMPPTEFVVTDLSVMERITGFRVDGVLGQPLFDGRYVLIDKDRKYLRLSAKQTTPVDGAISASY